MQPGVYSTVELKIPRKSPALIVRASAITFNQDGKQVAVVENGVAHLRKIATTTDYRTEVSEGVKDGDKVFLQPPVNLAEREKVQIIPAPPTAHLRTAKRIWCLWRVRASLHHCWPLAS